MAKRVYQEFNNIYKFVETFSFTSYLFLTKQMPILNLVCQLSIYEYYEKEKWTDKTNLRPNAEDVEGQIHGASTYIV